MKIRMYNMGFGDCFCLRDRRKNLLVDFGTSNNRIGGLRRSEVFDAVMSDLSTISHKNLLLTHFHLDHLSGLLYMMKKRKNSFEFVRIYLPDVFSRPEMSRTLALMLLADLAKDSCLPSHQVSLFALAGVLGKYPQNLELLSRGTVFEGRYQALWPDTGVIAEETEKFLKRIEDCDRDVWEKIVGIAEKLRRIIWEMINDAEKCMRKTEKISFREVEKEFRILRNTPEFIQFLSGMETQEMELRQFKNKVSIVFQNAEDGEWNLLFTGDVQPAHMRMIADNYDGKIPLFEHYWCIKVPHHGTESHYFNFSPYMPENLLISNGVYHANSKKRARSYRTSMQYTGLFQIGDGDTYMCCSSSECCDGCQDGCSCREQHIIAPNFYLDI
ncbi:MBL fold metallo-hydrolase [Blautia sp. HCP3S3_G3]|uniref:MBL fold metallo-hydrolase n=1 Tax=Blautia sp. HCP3S3_G3 TaxID=3438913 RepID=UPI003F88751C